MTDEHRPEQLPVLAGAPVLRLRFSGPGETLYVRQSDEPRTLARLLTAS
jgi:hypothetical protein